jgi:hypothetical protein
MKGGASSIVDGVGSAMIEDALWRCEEKEVGGSEALSAHTYTQKMENM